MTGWDRGLDLVKTYKYLSELYTKEEDQKRRDKLAVLIIQLRNGCRISEAIKAYEEFVQTGNRVLKVEVGKKKKKTYRDVVVPDFIVRPERIVAKISRTNMWNFAKEVLNTNTHSIRYAFITHLAALENVNPAIIAKIVCHSNLENLVTYIQEKIAVRKLLELKLD